MTPVYRNSILHISQKLGTVNFEGKRSTECEYKAVQWNHAFERNPYSRPAATTSPATLYHRCPGELRITALCHDHPLHGPWQRNSRSCSTVVTAPLCADVQVSRSSW